MPHTLLVADDSVTIQRVIELTFAGEAIEVTAVGDGDQAIARIDASPPDIVLADIGMPGKTGYEIAEYIKRSSRLAHIPVVLLTGAFEPVDQARAARAGCDGVLAKPFEPQLVIERVKELLARGATHEDAAMQGSATLPQRAPASDASTDRAALDSYFHQLDHALSALSTPETTDNATVAHRAAGPPEAPEVFPAAKAEGASTRVLPSLADAFAALLAAERHEQPSSAPTAWPFPAPARISDEMAEQITERVVQRLSTDATRAVVADIVSRVAERLVREEIEKIKGAIK